VLDNSSGKKKFSVLHGEPEVRFRDVECRIANVEFEKQEGKGDMRDWVRVLIDGDEERKFDFKVLFEVEAEEYTTVTVEFKKERAECINLSVRRMESLGYSDAIHLLRSVLSRIELAERSAAPEEPKG
jgi:hypothetical protein